MFGGFGSTVRGLARKVDTTSTNARDPHRYWGVRVLWNEVSKDFNLTYPNTDMFEIDLLDIAGSRLNDNADQSPDADYNTQYSSNAYQYSPLTIQRRVWWGWDCPVVVSAMNVHFRGCGNNYVLEYSNDLVHWYRAVKAYATVVHALGNISGNTLHQVTTEIWQ